MPNEKPRLADGLSAGYPRKRPLSRSVENLHLPQSVFAPSGGSHRPAFYAPWTSAHPSPFDSLGRVVIRLGVIKPGIR